MSEDLQVLLREAETLYEQAEWDQAQEKYGKILQRDPQNEEACYKIARIYSIRGMISNVVNQYFQLMDILDAQGALDQVVEVARWIQMIEPENDKARMKIILVNKRKGNVEEVVKQSLQLARLYIELGQGDQSIRLLQGAQEYVPDNLEIGLELAEMYMSHGHIQEAASQYRKIANAYLQRNQLEKAADAFRRMKVIVSDDEQLLLTLGNIYVNLNRFNEAEAEFRAVLRLDLNNVEALMALGNVCQLKGQFRDAILAFNKILSINPQEVKAKEKLGELHQAQGNHIESIKNYLSAAHIYQSSEETDKAVRLYQRVLTLDPTNPTACRELTNLGAPLVGEEEEEMTPYQPSIMPIPELMPGKFEAAAGAETSVAYQTDKNFLDTKKVADQKPPAAGMASGGFQASPAALPTMAPPTMPPPGAPPEPAFRPSPMDIPSIDAPTLDSPSMEVPTLDASLFDVPSLDLPGIDSHLQELPSFVGPSLASPAPAFDVPSLEAPSFDMPSFDLPSLEPQMPQGAAPTGPPLSYESPSLELPSFDTPALESPTPGIPSLSGPSRGAPQAPLRAFEPPQALGSSLGPSFDMPMHDASSMETSSLDDSLFDAGSFGRQAAEPSMAADARRGTKAPEEHSAFDPMSFDTTPLNQSMRTPGGGGSAFDPVSFDTAPLENRQRGFQHQSFEEAPQALYGHQQPFEEQPQMGYGHQQPFEEQPQMGYGHQQPVEDAPRYTHQQSYEEIPLQRDYGYQEPFQETSQQKASVKGFERGDNQGAFAPFEDANAARASHGHQDQSSLYGYEDEQQAVSSGSGMFSRKDKAGGGGRKEGLLLKRTVDKGKKKGFGAKDKGLLKPTLAVEVAPEQDETRSGFLRTKGEEAGKPRMMVNKPALKERLSDNRSRPASTPARGAMHYEQDAQDESSLPFAPPVSREMQSPQIQGPQIDPYGDPYADPFADPFAAAYSPTPAASPIRAEASPLYREEPGFGDMTMDDNSLLMPPMGDLADDSPLGPESTMSDDSLLMPPLADASNDRTMPQGAFHSSAPALSTPFAGDMDFDNPYSVREETQAQSAITMPVEQDSEGFGAHPFSTSLPDISMPGSNFEMNAMESPFESAPLMPSYDIPSGEGRGQSPFDFAAAPTGTAVSQKQSGEFGDAMESMFTLDESAISSTAVEMPVSFWDAPEGGFSKGMMDSPVADAPMFPLDDTKVPQPSMEPQSSLFGPDESASAPMDGGIDWGILGDGASGLQDFSDENMEIKSHPASRLDEMDASMGTVNEWQIPSEMPPFSIIQETLTDEEKKEIFTGIGITDVPHIALEAQASSMSKIEEETDKLRDVLEAGDYSSAIELYTRILADYPGNIDLRAELAELYYNFALMDEAAEQFTLLIEKDPQRLDYHQKLSNLHLMNQNIDGAIPEILFIAQAYLERKEYALSLEYLQAILALDSSNIEAREALVDIYVEQKSDRIALYHLNILANVAIQKSEREKAVALLKKIFNLTGDIDVQLKLAQTLEEYEYPDDAVNEYISLTGKFRDGGDDDNACQCLERIVRIQKENLDAHYQLIDIYGRLGDMEKALEAKHELSGILLSIGEKERALEVLEEILRARPDHHDARHTLIDIYLEKEMVEKALVEAQVLADVYFKEKKVDSAIELYQKLVNADPQNLTLRERLAHFYMMSDRTDSALKEVITIASSLSTRGSWDEAIKTYKKALQIDDRNADIRYQLGLILLDKKGNTRDALMEFQKVFEIDSGHKENTKKYITVLLTEGRPEEAMKVLDKLISLDASNAVLKDEIISSYKKKVEENDDDIQSRYFLGIIYKELKMLDDAIEQFQKTKRINEYFMPSSNMLAMCFALKPGMQQIAVRTLKKALETKEFDEESKLELRYSLAGLMEGSSNPQEALNCYQEIFKTDITYRDVAQKIKLLKDQVGGGGTPGGAKITRLIPREPGGFGD